MAERMSLAAQVRKVILAEEKVTRKRGKERLLKFSKQDLRYRYARQVIRLFVVDHRSGVAVSRVCVEGFI